MSASAIADELPSSSISERPRPSPQNFYAFVPYACARLGATFCVKIKVETQAGYNRVEEKLKRPRSQRPRDFQSLTSWQAATEEQESEASRETRRDVALVILTAVQDSAGNLVELVFNRIGEIPVMLIKVIGMCVPYQPQLYKLTVKWTPLSTVTVYELSKFMSQVTEVCLDGSPLAGRNYHLLLKHLSRLYYLSLVNCKLDDEDCALLAELLTLPRAAAASLHVLLLASNKIGDEGARALAQTLRSNRGLHYLNLAGNRITDSGAISIFKSLMEFPLTKDESRGKGLRQIKFLRQRADAYANFFKELTREDKSTIDDRVSKKFKPIRGTKTDPEYSAADTIVQRANFMTDKLVGTFTDAFTNDKTVVHGDKLYCVGNMALCGLNLSYNNLQFPSITYLWNVLKQQSCLEAAARTEPGLLRVRVDGNNLPSACCEELQSVVELLERAVARVSRQFTGVGKGAHGVVTKSKLLAYSRMAVSHKPPSV